MITEATWFKGFALSFAQTVVSVVIAALCWQVFAIINGTTFLALMMLGIGLSPLWIAVALVWDGKEKAASFADSDKQSRGE